MVKLWVAATAAVALVMSNSVRPHRWQPARLLCPWDSLGKNTWVGCHFLLQCMHAKLLQLCLTLWDPMDSSPPESSEFSRQEYWSELPCPSPVSGWEAAYQDSALKVDFFLSQLVTVFFSPLWQRLLEHLKMQATVQQRARYARMRSQVGLRKHHQRWWNSSRAVSNPKGWCC